MTPLQEQLSELGRQAAGAVGLGRVSEVEVFTGRDSSDQPALVFSFLVDQDRDRARAALLRTRLSQRLRDELLKREDARYPIIHLFTERDWEKRERARFG
jgi:hypothetical protein